MATIVTVTSIFRSKDGKAFESAEVKKVIELLRREEGVVRQYWGEQVENPGLVVWVVVIARDWSSSSSEEIQAAVTSGITEVAYFTLSTTGDITVKEAKRLVDEELSSFENVKTYGKCHGAASGWVTSSCEGCEIVILHAVFGYDSLEDHMEWRRHPKIKDAARSFEALAKKGSVLRPEVRVKGVGSDTGYFHVKFECV